MRASTRDGSADDLASDVWIEVARGLGGFEGDEQALWGWVFTIAWRRLIDARRRASRQRTNPIEPVAQAQLAGTTQADFEAQEALEEALSLVADLPRAQAEVVLLRVLGDLSVETTAQILGKRPGAVRILQHRAFARLRGQLRSRY
jgi:RNA polymerase sigma-70 factor (ECF subfamily)